MFICIIQYKKLCLCMFVNNPLFLSSWLNVWYFTYLDLYVVSFYLDYCSWFVCGCFLISVLVVCLKSYYYFISRWLNDWFLTYMHLYVVTFNLNYCSEHVCGFFTRSDIFVCLKADHFLIWNILIDSFLTYFDLHGFPFIWIIVARMFVAVSQEMVLFVCL